MKSRFNYFAYLALFVYLQSHHLSSWQRVNALWNVIKIHKSKKKNFLYLVFFASKIICYRFISKFTVALLNTIFLPEYNLVVYNDFSSIVLVFFAFLPEQLQKHSHWAPNDYYKTALVSSTRFCHEISNSFSMRWTFTQNTFDHSVVHFMQISLFDTLILLIRKTFQYLCWKSTWWELAKC